MMNLKQGYTKEQYPFPVKRYCQILELKASDSGIEEYRYWHRSENIWKEIPEGIRRAGILDMEIYLHGAVAFMIVETPIDFDWDEAFGRLASFERQSEWEEFVARFQQVEPGKRSDQKWTLMERVFSLNS
ncbi:MAG: L-rhamnose mutarotase [Prevotellaceae bacterium]|nr:L-rhamnose mutarotase [Prevotellaceae bacterium]